MKKNAPMDGEKGDAARTRVRDRREAPLARVADAAERRLERPLARGEVAEAEAVEAWVGRHVTFGHTLGASILLASAETFPRPVFCTRESPRVSTKIRKTAVSDMLK